MAKVILQPIGSNREKFCDDKSWQERLDSMGQRVDSLNTMREHVRAGWGDKYRARVVAKGKLPTWDRLEQLKDPGTPILSVGTLVNQGRDFGGKESPGAGVHTVFLRIQDRWCVVIANDNSVASGSWWPQTPEKIQRAQEIALRMRLPVVYLVDSSGLYLPEQSQSFPGRHGGGAIFKMNAELSAAGVPQIAGVLGDCIAGGGYMPLISDVVFMTEQAYMVIAGAALIKGAKSKSLTSLDIGGADVHVHLSRCADERVPNDEVLLTRVRQEIAKLPGSGADFYRFGAESAPPSYPAEELDGIFPVDHRMSYDMHQVLARLVDHSQFWEMYRDTGPEIICGVARIGGLYTGIVANNPQLTDHPTQHGAKRPGGILYREGIAKIAQFSRACNDDGIPILWLQDISGFDIGVEAERQGLLGYGSSLIYANSTNSVPMFTVLLRKASGAGYYAMAGLPYAPVVQLATPITRLSVMEGRTLSIATYNTRLDDDFEISTDDPDERREIEEGMKRVESRIEKDMDPVHSASQRDIDEIVPPSELRLYLESMVEMAYQSIGYRRVKNPRIWSMHDLKVLGG